MVDPEVVGAVEERAIVVVQQSSRLVGEWIKYVYPRSLLYDAAITRAGKGEASFRSPIDLAIVIFASVHGVDRWVGSVVLDCWRSVVQIYELLCVYALVWLREDDHVQALHVYWCLMNAVVSCIEDTFDFWRGIKYLQPTRLVEYHERGVGQKLEGGVGGNFRLDESVVGRDLAVGNERSLERQW